MWRAGSRRPRRRKSATTISYGWVNYEGQGLVLSAWKWFWTLSQIKAKNFSLWFVFYISVLVDFFFSCCEQTPGKKQFEERKVYLNLQPRKGIQSTVSRRVWWQLQGSQWSYCISRSQEQTGSGDWWESFKSCPYRATSSSTALSLEGFATFQKSTSSWGPCVQTHQPMRDSS